MQCTLTLPTVIEENQITNYQLPNGLIKVRRRQYNKYYTSYTGGEQSQDRTNQTAEHGDLQGASPPGRVVQLALLKDSYSRSKTNAAQQ
jgi:hypothetical protein